MQRASGDLGAWVPAIWQPALTAGGEGQRQTGREARSQATAMSHNTLQRNLYSRGCQHNPSANLDRAGGSRLRDVVIGSRTGRLPQISIDCLRRDPVLAEAGSNRGVRLLVMFAGIGSAESAVAFSSRALATRTAFARSSR